MRQRLASRARSNWRRCCSSLKHKCAKQQIAQQDSAQRMRQRVERRDAHRVSNSSMKAKSHGNGDGGEHSNPAVAQEKAEKRRDIEEKKAGEPEGDDANVVARARKEILRDSADQIAEPGVPANRDAILCNSNSRTKARPLDDFSQLHVIQDFHCEPPVCPAGFVDGTFHHLERADSHVEIRMGIAHPVGVRGNLEDKAKKCDEQLFPETSHINVTEERGGPTCAPMPA